MPRRTMTHLLLLTCCLMAGRSQPLQAEPGEQNLLPNPSFEKLERDAPASWKATRWGGDGTLSVSDAARSGQRSLQITSDQGGDLSWSATVAVQPHATYRLSGWIKTENLKGVPQRRGRGALLNVHNIQSVATEAISGTQDWTRVEAIFETDSNDAVQVNCLFGGWGFATGTAWFDDVQLELLSAADWQPTIVIHADQPGQPVSKYVYGQFIEHLGRCIYGGIWAEMLEDRKFYHPITADYAPYGNEPVAPDTIPVVKASPWQMRGAANGVSMVGQDPFVGEHTPLVEPGSGIAQNDLALVKGKQYVGYIWLKAQAGVTEATVALSGASAPAKFTTGSQGYTQHTFSFTSKESTSKASLSVDVKQNPCFVGTLSLMPADHVQGMRADTLELLKKLNSPVYRWPGGNFVSGYDWRDGLGDRDRRPPRKNPAWTGVEHNDFGLDEFLVFCQLLDTEPYIAVNSGLGSVDEAMAEVQYANGSADTPMGALRAKHGHPEPYAVQWWSIGNEMYGSWQLGHMSLEKYVQKHNEFADAMRRVDPAIKLIAVGDAGPWSEGMMQHCADHMDLISEHFYCQERPGLASHVAQIPDAIRRKAVAHREYRKNFASLEGKDIQIAMDEWNYWYGPHPYGELGTRYFLKDALGIAAGIHEYARQSDLMFMANYAQTVNVIGCIKTTKTDASLETTGLALQLYRAHFGTTPLKVQTQSPLDVAAALSPDGKMLTVGVVNPTMQALDLTLTLQGCTLSGGGQRWQIAGSDPMAYNTPGQPPRVQIEKADVNGTPDTLQVAPCSVTLFALPLK